MKLLLLLALYCTLVQARRRYSRNDNCLIRNWYPHESKCHSPRRYFYAFHRIISDCVQVTTHCPRMYRHNEYISLRECRNDCWFFVLEGAYPTTTMAPPTDDSTDGTDPTADTGDDPKPVGDDKPKLEGKATAKPTAKPKPKPDPDTLEAKPVKEDKPKE